MASRKRTQIPDCKDCSYKENSLFCILHQDELEEVSDSKSHVLFKKGQIVFHEGNITQGLYCIYDGKVKIHKWGGDGKEQIIRLARKNNVLGYRALMSGEPYNATATALEDTLMCFIPKQDIMEMLNKNSKLSMQAIKMLTGDLKFAEERTMNMAQKHVRERIAEALLMLQDHYGLEEDGETISSTLTRREIGGVAGTTTETTIRVISDLKKEGVIALEGKKIKIKDQKKLEWASNQLGL